jgi:hypothetical protein
MTSTTPHRRLALLVAAASLTLPALCHAAKRHPVAVVADDLDADPGCMGCPDLAIAEGGLRAISVRFGNGDGTFDAPVNLALKGAAFAVALGDCDNDGDVDVIATSAGGRLSVFRNQQMQGSPQTFVEAAGSPMALGGKVLHLVARVPGGASLDLNGDGKPDLAAVSGKKTVITLRGDGECGFAPPVATPYLGTHITGLAAGDFDAANGVDLVVTDTFGAVATTLQNDGSGDFGIDGGSPLSPGPTSITAADLDANGVPDAVTTSTEQYGAPESFGVNVLHGNAGLGLSAANQYGSGGRAPVASVVGNFDGGAAVDIVAVNRKESSLGFLAGLGAADFVAPVTSPIGGHNPLALAAGDFTGDGKLDVVVVLRSGGTIDLCAGDGAGHFTCTPVP